MPHVITITGASGAGKSTAIEYFLRARSERYLPISVPKYKTRPPRGGGVREDDGVFVAEIPAACDLVYEQYGVRYGLESRVLFENVRKGLSPILILNDVRTVQDVRRMLGPAVVSIFIFRERPTLAAYRALLTHRSVCDEEEVYRRYNKAHATYRIYIENIHVFDRVLLNSWGRRDLNAQVVRLVRTLDRDANWPLRGERS